VASSAAGPRAGPGPRPDRRIRPAGARAHSCSNDSVTTRQPSWPGGSAASSAGAAARRRPRRTRPARPRGGQPDLESRPARLELRRPASPERGQLEPPAARRLGQDPGGGHAPARNTGYPRPRPPGTSSLPCSPARAARRRAARGPGAVPDGQLAAQRSARAGPAGRAHPPGRRTTAACRDAPAGPRCAGGDPDLPVRAGQRARQPELAQDGRHAQDEQASASSGRSRGAGTVAVHQPAAAAGPASVTTGTPRAERRQVPVHGPDADPSSAASARAVAAPRAGAAGPARAAVGTHERKYAAIATQDVSDSGVASAR